jgi:hypothetical protein
MQRLFNITLFLLSFGVLCSCGKLVSKEYKLKNQPTAQKEFLSLLLEHKGIYDVRLDSAENILYFKYLPKKTDLEELELFLEENDLLKEEIIPAFKTKNIEEDEEQLALDTILQTLSEELPEVDSLIENAVLPEEMDTAVTITIQE